MYSTFELDASAAIAHVEKTKPCIAPKRVSVLATRYIEAHLRRRLRAQSPMLLIYRSFALLAKAFEEWPGLGNHT